MLTVVVVLKILLVVAVLSLLGQGLLYLLAGAGRETNLFYRILRTMAAPATRATRFITPRKLVPDHHIGKAAFFLVAGLYIALIIMQAEYCLKENMRHFSCEPLVKAYEKRCAAGQNEACQVLERAIQAR